jgi:hypothetical protein
MKFSKYDNETIVTRLKLALLSGPTLASNCTSTAAFLISMTSSTTTYSKSHLRQRYLDSNLAYLEYQNIDNQPITNTMADYSQQKVPDLKKLLQERGLVVSGNKADLVARLQEDDNKKAGTSAAAGKWPMTYAHMLHICIARGC